MDINLNRAGVSLARHRYLALRDAAGTQVLCSKGSVWITQDGDRNDYLLGAGERMRLDADGLALVQAEDPACVVLLEPGADAARAPSSSSIWARAGRWLYDALKSSARTRIAALRVL